MKQKRAPGPRWAKILRNLLLAVLLGVMMWDMWDQPTFFYMADLRRRERRALFPEAAETAVELDTADGVKYRIEVADGAAVTAYPVRGKLFVNANASFHRLEEGPDLLCLSRPVELPDEFGQALTYAAYAAVQPPAGSASAVLTLHSEDGGYTAEGVREGEIFLFFFRPEDADAYNYNRLLHPGEYTWELAFYDENGGEVQALSG